MRGTTQTQKIQKGHGEIMKTDYKTDKKVLWVGNGRACIQFAGETVGEIYTSAELLRLVVSGERKKQQDKEVL